jgi:1-deoxy-D-xylulose-5-phosphate synthase
MILPQIETPEDLRSLSTEQLEELAQEIRSFIVETVTTTGGHLGSNLGVVELTLALHRVFDSPKDPILWDTGHQAYVHKLLTGRRYGFKDLRKQGGLSGYPNRGESEHDWIENSHASTVLSYAYGVATAYELEGQLAGHGGERRVVAVIGDGALTGGMAYEALNNLGHSGRRVVIVLNDNGRSYAPTISQLSQSLTSLRLHPTYVQARERLRHILREIPAVGEVAYSGVHGVTSALRELVAPHTFFEALGVRYAGPIDGHDITAVEQALRNAAAWDGPIVVHVLTQKGRGYAPAEEDEVQRLHDVKVVASTPDVDDGADIAPSTYTDAFSRSLLSAAAADPTIVALTAAMPGPTGLLPFEAAHPNRFVDVGIAEQHEMTAAAGMAMGGLRPVVAVYSTFFTRAIDQATYDVGMHNLPVTIVLDRAGITGDDGASHHGVLDLALCLTIPNMTVFAPSSADEVDVMLTTALSLDGPATLRFPKTPPEALDGKVGEGLSSRTLRQGDGSLCLLGVGKMTARCLAAADILERDHGIAATVVDVRVVSPIDPSMLELAGAHRCVVTVEDGIRVGGAGSHIAAALAESEAGRGRTSPPVTILGTPKAFLAQAKPDVILTELGLDAPGIAASSVDAWSRSAAAARPQA